MLKLLFAFPALAAAGLVTISPGRAAGSNAYLVPASLNLKLAAPIKTWDEAVPLGNGAMGVLLWGETNLLRLSLDRGDLWDERPSPAFLKVHDKFKWATLQQLVASNRMDEFNAICDANYDYKAAPTKLPAGRVEITLDPSKRLEMFELDLARAEGIAHGKTAELARAFVNAADVEQPVALVLIQGPPLKDVQLKTPGFGQEARLSRPPHWRGGGLALVRTAGGRRVFVRHLRSVETGRRCDAAGSDGGHER